MDKSYRNSDKSQPPGKLYQEINLPGVAVFIMTMPPTIGNMQKESNNKHNIQRIQKGNVVRRTRELSEDPIYTYIYILSV